MDRSLDGYCRTIDRQRLRCHRRCSSNLVEVRERFGMERVAAHPPERRRSLCSRSRLNAVWCGRGCRRGRGYWRRCRGRCGCGWRGRKRSGSRESLAASSRGRGFAPVHEARRATELRCAAIGAAGTTSGDLECLGRRPQRRPTSISPIGNSWRRRLLGTVPRAPDAVAPGPR
jgi:hypothetical protein